MTHPKELLAPFGIDPKQSLGQNFLFDPQLLQKIVDTAGVTTADAVLEVGPGLGGLTRLLAEQAQRVVAVELDDRLLPILAEELEAYDNVTLVHGDILEQDPAEWFADEPSYKVVANVPYYITGAILRHLLEAPVKPGLMVLTVQKEVAERLVAQPPKMSILAVSVQFYGAATHAYNLAAGAFWPRPKVASAVVVIDCAERPLAASAVTDEDAFFRLVKTGFSQKRKQLQKNLRSLYDRKTIAAGLAAAGIEGQRRAETLSIEEWVGLYQAFGGE